MEFKASDLFAEYTAALHSGKVSNKVKQPWFRKHWKSDDDLDEQIKLWKNKIEKALTMPTMPVLPAPVGPAQKQDDDEPPVKVVKLESNLPHPVEHSSWDKLCEPVDMEIDNVKLEADTSQVIDLHYIQTLHPEKALLGYVQEQSKFYANTVDDDSRAFIGSLVGACTQFVPCGRFNKDNSCPKDFIHNDQNHEKRIHACLLCYFVFSGMINIHRLPQCPLLGNQKS